jgi:hypothetical protein
MSLQRKLKKLIKVRHKLKKLEKKEKRLKQAIHSDMNQLGVNDVEFQNIIAKRQNRVRSIIRKQNVPEDIWEEYAEAVVFPVLTAKRI